MCCDSGTKGEGEGIGVGATVNLGMCRIQVVWLILCIVQFKPGVGRDKVGARRFRTVPGRVWYEQYFVENNNARNCWHG